MWQAVVPFPRFERQIDLMGDDEIHRALPELKSVQKGWLNLFVRGSGAALSVNENCDPTVRSDLTQALERILPKPSKAAADAAADARALLMSTSLTLPVSSGSITFGTWQGVYFAQFRRDAPGDLILTLADGGSAAQADFTYDANKRQSHGICAQVENLLKESSCLSSTLLVHEKHTSASLSVAGSDLEPSMRTVVPEKWNEEFFEHTYEGPDDMPGHVKSTLLGCGVVVPLVEGRAALGAGQNVMLNEHRDVGGYGVGHSRRVQVTELPIGSRRIIEVFGKTEDDRPGTLIDITEDICRAAAEASADVAATSPGLAHIFAASPVHGVLVAGAIAANILAARLRDLIRDAAARAAIAKNGPVLPLDQRGQLLLGEGQRIWLYDAEDGRDGPREGKHVVITVHKVAEADVHMATL